MTVRHVVYGFVIMVVDIVCGDLNVNQVYCFLPCICFPCCRVFLCCCGFVVAIDVWSC